MSFHETFQVLERDIAKWKIETHHKVIKIRFEILIKTAERLSKRDNLTHLHFTMENIFKSRKLFVFYFSSDSNLTEI